MRYKMFARSAMALGALVLTGLCVCAKREIDAPASQPAPLVASPPSSPTPMVPPVPSYQPPPILPATPVLASAPQPSGSMSTVVERRARLETWLAANADRQGRTYVRDVMPSEPFRATAYRFPDADAVRFSNNPTQWSQIRLDLNRDGVDDEKWLLMNGHTHKREALGPDGRTVTQTEYFN